MLDVFEDLGEGVDALLGEQADLAYEAGNAARGEGPAREAEQEDLIAGVVVIGEKRVALSDCVAKTVACRS